jgi:type IV secretory pathway TrbD component
MGTTTRRGGFEPILVGGGVLGLVLLATLGAVIVGWLPWQTLLAAWLGGNAMVLLALSRRANAADGHTVADPVTPA